MKKGNLLNADIVEVIAKMGHTDTIVIGDAGLPIPDHVRRIDLALVKGVPSFDQVLNALLDTFICESFTLAKEIKEFNPNMEITINEKLHDVSGNYVSHEEFKELCKNAKAVIRTGECSAYANIILKSGVIF